MEDYFNLCSIIAVGSYSTMRDTYPIVEKIELNNWDFFLSILAFWLFTVHINKGKKNFNDEEKNIYLKTRNQFIKEYSDFEAGFNHLLKFVNNIKEDSSLPNELGFWLSTNLFDKNASTLSKEEFNIGFLTAQLVRTQVMSCIK